MYTSRPSLRKCVQTNLPKLSYLQLSTTDLEAAATISSLAEILCCSGLRSDQNGEATNRFHHELQAFADDTANLIARHASDRPGGYCRINRPTAPRRGLPPNRGRQRCPRQFVRYANRERSGIADECKSVDHRPSRADLLAPDSAAVGAGLPGGNPSQSFGGTEQLTALRTIFVQAATQTSGSFNPRKNLLCAS
jgi:hypothetical protein